MGRGALSPLPLLFSQNDLFSDGLSTSLKRGVRSVPDAADGVVVLLADMPGVSSEMIDRLISSFDPVAGRTICVPVWQGRRGNPVLWGRAHFDEILTLEGDSGAKALIARHPSSVWEVQADGDGVLIDLDTPTALADYEKL